jgi:hypothetical protein
MAILTMSMRRRRDGEVTATLAPTLSTLEHMLLHRDGKAIVEELGLVRQQQLAGAHHHRDAAAGDVVDEARAEAEARRGEAPLSAAQRAMVCRRVPDTRARASRVEQRVRGQLAPHSLRGK